MAPVVPVVAPSGGSSRGKGKEGRSSGPCPACNDGGATVPPPRYAVVAVVCGRAAWCSPPRPAVAPPVSPSPRNPHLFAKESPIGWSPQPSSQRAIPPPCNSRRNCQPLPPCHDTAIPESTVCASREPLGTHHPASRHPPPLPLSSTVRPPTPPALKGRVASFSRAPPTYACPRRPACPPVSVFSQPLHAPAPTCVPAVPTWAGCDEKSVETQGGACH